MSALLTNHESRIRWVPVDVASTLLGKSEGHLRRVCKSLMPKGQATKIGNKWHIAASYSPRLARQAIETDDDGGSEFHELLRTTPADKLATAQIDAQILIAFRSMRTGSYASFPVFKEAMIATHGRCPGKSQMYDKDKMCPASEDFQGIVVALIDRRGRPKGDSGSCSDIAWAHFCDYYLTQNQLSLSKCHRMVDALANLPENNWAWPSHSRVRQLAAKRIDPSTMVLKREGLDAWNRKHLAPMTQDPNAWDVGQCWESDHSVLDFHCREFKGNKWVRSRPQLTTWVDRRTRMMMGYHISGQGNAYTIRLALLNALKNPANSVPKEVWLDNGKDFMASSITGMTKSARRKASRDEIDQTEEQATGILGMLGIKPHFARPYNHNGKSRQERFYGTVHGEFDKEFASYCGYKPGMLDHRDQLAIQKDTMNLPTVEDVREKFTEFARWYNFRSDHHIDDLRDPKTLERLSPAEFYQRYLQTKLAVKQESLILLEPVWSNALKVQKNGIGLRIGAQTVRYGELMPELESLVGTDKRVFVSWNPSDTNSVTVWDQDFQFICIAQENGRYGGLAQDTITLEDRKSAYNARKEQLKRVKQKTKIVDLTLTPAEAASKAARDREVAETKSRMAEFDSTRDPNDMPSLRLVHTRIDNAPTDIEEQQQRVAVGAESYDPNEFGSLIDAINDQFNPSQEEEVIDDSILLINSEPNAHQHHEETYGSLIDHAIDIDMACDDGGVGDMRLVDYTP